MKLKLPGSSAASRTPSISTPSIGTPGLNLTSPSLNITIPATNSAAAPNQTPASAVIKKQTIKLKNHSTPSTPNPVDETPKPKKTKTGRTTKPSAKVVESRKRGVSEDESDEEEVTIAVQPPPTKRLKLQIGRPASTPNLKLKAKKLGKPPKRNFGEGYDSEASDREIDPAIEEEFILRMLPGEDCNILQKWIADKKIGLPKSQGGADVQMKFFHNEGRRASVTVRGNVYAATLVDLPCIIEAMKSWDKRGWWKSADICQMLWVFARVKNDEEAKTIALPKIIDSQTYQYPHGITPPMHYAKKRRFRKRISRTAIEAVEEEVEKLLAADAAASSSRYEWIQPDNGSRQASAMFSDDEGGDDYADDAEGEIDEGYFNDHRQNGMMAHEDVSGLEADLEAALEEESLAATPASANGASPAMNGDTPAMEEAEDSGDESGVDDDDEGDEVDEDELARQAQQQGLREDLLEAEAKLQSLLSQLALQQNPILRKRIETNIKQCKEEIEMKKSALGDGEEDDDD